MYEYRCEVLRVVDGDTLHARVDLGCDTRIDLTLRLAGINAPEAGTPEGTEATAYLVHLLERDPEQGEWLMLRTVKDRREKYGRYLANLAMVGTTGERSINLAMVDGGHATPYA